MHGDAPPPPCRSASCMHLFIPFYLPISKLTLSYQYISDGSRTGQSILNGFSPKLCKPDDLLLLLPPVMHPRIFFHSPLSGHTVCSSEINNCPFSSVILTLYPSIVIGNDYFSILHLETFNCTFYCIDQFPSNAKPWSMFQTLPTCMPLAKRHTLPAKCSVI